MDRSDCLDFRRRFQLDSVYNYVLTPLFSLLPARRYHRTNSVYTGPALVGGTLKSRGAARCDRSSPAKEMEEEDATETARTGTVQYVHDDVSRRKQCVRNGEFRTRQLHLPAVTTSSRQVEVSFPSHFFATPSA